MEGLLKKDGKIIHRVSLALGVGDAVELMVDWNRRFRNMQQHTGQHLISAVAMANFGLKTAGWSIGTDNSHGYIDFEGADFLGTIVDTLEDDVNDIIFENRPIEISFNFDSEKYRGIIIDGFSINYCCGTHLRQTSQLQIAKFYGVEKKGDKWRLYFRTGKKALLEWRENRNRIVGCCKTLTCGEQELLGIVSKMKNSSKATEKELSKMGEFMGEIMITLMGHEKAVIINFPIEPVQSFLKLWNSFASKNLEISIVAFGNQEISFWICGLKTDAVCQAINKNNPGNRDIVQFKVTLKEKDAILAITKELFPAAKKFK